MYNLDLKTKIDDYTTLVQSPNLAEELHKDDLASLGLYCKHIYEYDVASRSMWETKMVPIVKSAMQLYEEKTFPWQGASNIKLPLITISAFQYHTRVYSLLLQGQDVVNLTYYGDDPKGIKDDMSKRIAQHLNYQILEQDKEWEENMDLTFLIQSIMGCAFKKISFSVENNHPISRFVSPWDLIVPYYTKSMENFIRVSHRMSLSENDCYERHLRGVFLKLEGDPRINQATNRLKDIQQETMGIGTEAMDSEAPFEVIEQHRFLDLDKDGYLEPYIVTFAEGTGQVLRVVARYFEDSISYNEEFTNKPKIRYIKPHNMFVKYPFIPSVDGCFYDMGFGSILEGLSHSVDSLFNQMIDAGSLSNLGGGFISRNLVIRSGGYRFAPGEYKIVDATGASLQEGIKDLPIREPSEVLFNLLELMLSYADRVAGSTEPQQGENPGQNTPRGTYVDMLEEGGKIFKGLFKRTYRAFREELNKLYEINSLYLSDDVTKFNSLNTSMDVVITKDDYIQHRGYVKPSADPEVGSDAMKVVQSQSLLEVAQNNPGFDQYSVMQRFLKSMKISNIDEVYPPPEVSPPEEPPEDPRITVANIRADVEKQKNLLDNKIELLKMMFLKMISEDRMTSAEAMGAAKLAEASVKVGESKIRQYLDEVNRIQEQNRGMFAELERVTAEANEQIIRQQDQQSTQTSASNEATLAEEGSNEAKQVGRDQVSAIKDNTGR